MSFHSVMTHCIQDLSDNFFSVKHQAHHLSGQILECRDVEGSQDAVEIDGKRVDIRICHHASPVDDIVVAWGWTGHCRVSSRGRLCSTPRRVC